MASMTWEALVVWEVGTALEVVQQEGDPPGFESAPAVVDGLLEDGAASHKFADFCINLSLLFLPASVAHDFGVGLPVR